MRIKAKSIFLKLFISTLFLFLTHDALAAFSLSVSPYEGGYDLRFGKVSLANLRVNKEVTLKVTSDLGKQYRITQSLLDPLTNAQGKVIPSTNLRVYTLRGSNATGTLGVDNETSVTDGSMVLYTSNPSGNSDSFIVVYGLSNPSDLEPGRYFGRLYYTLEPLDSSQGVRTVTINVTAEIDAGSDIEISTYTGSKVIELKYEAPDQKTNVALPAHVTINIKGNLGSQYRIVQALSDTLRSAEGEVLPKDGLCFSLSGADNGTLKVAGLEALSNQPQVIYTSGKSGESDAININFSLNDIIMKAKQGIYRGNINYFIEGNIPYPKGGLLETIQLAIKVEPMFNLVINTSTGNSIEFRGLKSNQPPEVSIVTLEVKANLGKPYQIIQEVSGLLTNKEGKTISDEYFTLRTEGETSGTLKYPDKSAVKKGQSVLYISDKEGSSATFKAVYELTVPSDLVAGNYSTAINYSLLEI